MLQQLPVTFGFKVPSSYAKPLMVQDAAACLEQRGAHQLLLHWKSTTLAEKRGCSICQLEPKAKTRGIWNQEVEANLVPDWFKPLNLFVPHTQVCFAWLKVITALISQSFLYCFFFLNCLSLYLLMLLIVLLMRQRGLVRWARTFMSQVICSNQAACASQQHRREQLMAEWGQKVVGIISVCVDLGDSVQAPWRQSVSS